MNAGVCGDFSWAAMMFVGSSAAELLVYLFGCRFSAMSGMMKVLVVSFGVDASISNMI